MSRRSIAILIAGVLVAAVVTMWEVYFSLEADPAAVLIAESRGRSCPGPCAFAFGPDAASVGLILYPGAGVEPAAYAPLAAAVAESGFMVTIQRATLDLAIFDSDMAQASIDGFPRVDSWAVGGHSLGGAIAARFAAEADAVDGLVLLAAYPEDALDLSDSDLDVLSIYAAADLLATPIEVLGAAERLPADAVFVEIKGGNHAQFGSYGRQPRDGVASIDPAEQRRVVAEAIDGFLSDLGSSHGG